MHVRRSLGGGPDIVGCLSEGSRKHPSPSPSLIDTKERRCGVLHHFIVSVRSSGSSVGILVESPDNLQSSKGGTEEAEGHVSKKDTNLCDGVQNPC